MLLTKTGCGYYVKNGKKLHKFDFELGQHTDPGGYTWVECATREEFDSIILDKTDAQIESDARESLIAKNKASGKAKLKSLGITDDEITALVGV